jgi:IrrE N-terminal-like domain
VTGLLWVQELAAAFWKEVGKLEPFPRTLSRAIHQTLPLRVRYLPGLRLAEVRDRLQRDGISLPDDAVDRLLRACLTARYGHGFIFIDQNDPEDEQRFSLAHELAHFLRDYWQPRHRACHRLGEHVLEVFDGKRPPTTAERINALLAHVPIGFHVHLLERDGQDRLVDRAVARAEDEADLLAYELLAPAAAVSATMVAQEEHAVLVRVLQEKYRLPAAQARAYSQHLLPRERPVDPLLRRFPLMS